VFLTLVVWIGGYGLFLNNVHTMTPINPTQKTDAIVVLTGGNDRIRAGLSLHAQGLSDTLFITGVNNAVTKNMILKMKAPSVQLPDCCILLGYKATTTVENALETKEWVANYDMKNVKTIRLVTSNYHMDRSFLEMKRQLPKTDIIKHPIKKNELNLTSLKFWRLTIEEYHKILFRHFATKLAQKQ